MPVVQWCSVLHFHLTAIRPWFKSRLSVWSSHVLPVHTWVLFGHQLPPTVDLERLIGVSKIAPRCACKCVALATCWGCTPPSPNSRWGRLQQTCAPKKDSVGSYFSDFSHFTWEMPSTTDLQPLTITAVGWVNKGGANPPPMFIHIGTGTSTSNPPGKDFFQ